MGSTNNIRLPTFDPNLSQIPFFPLEFQIIIMYFAPIAQTNEHLTEQT